MKEQQTEQQTGQRTASGAILERIGEAKIEGERRRLEKMTPAQRARDHSLQKIVFGIFTFVIRLVYLGLLITLFVTYPVCRIPLVIFVVLVFWLSYRYRKR